MGQVGFHRTVPLVLLGTGGIGRTHRIVECTCAGVEAQQLSISSVFRYIIV